MPDETTDPRGDEGLVAPDPTEDLRARIETLEKEKQDTYERLLRTAADLDNFRKRSRKDVEDARFKAREEVLREILPVMDNLERALQAAGDTGGPVVEGIRLVLRQFQSALERFDVRPFVAVGEAFDPARHEAISQIEAPDRAPGTVAAEMQRGYTMGDRLLRPALVAVAKAPPAPAAEEEAKT